MATTIGPLHCDAASGSLRKQITYRRSRRGATVTAYARPGSFQPFTPTAAQLAVRTTTRTLMQLWPTLAPPQQRTWDADAAAAGVPAINAFYANNFPRVHNGHPPILTRPPDAFPPVNYFTSAVVMLIGDDLSWAFLLRAVPPDAASNHMIIHILRGLSYLTVPVPMAVGLNQGLWINLRPDTLLSVDFQLRTASDHAITTYPAPWFGS